MTAPPPQRTAIVPEDLAELANQDLPILDPIEIAHLEQRLIDEVTTRQHKLPPFPATAAKVFELVEEPHVDLNKLVTALHWEPAIATELLRVANSAKYARGVTDDLRSAVLALGMSEVTAIVAGVTATSLFEIESRVEFELFPALWIAAHRETLAVAFTASWLAQQRSIPRHDRVFLRAIIEGAARTLTLRALAAVVLEGKLPMPGVDVIAAAADEAQPRVAELAIQRWDLPLAVANIVGTQGEIERDLIATVRTIVELRRTAWRDQAAARLGHLARTIKLDSHWLKVLVRELDEVTVRVDSMLQNHLSRAA